MKQHPQGHRPIHCIMDDGTYTLVIQPSTQEMGQLLDINLFPDSNTTLHCLDCEGDASPAAIFRVSVDVLKAASPYFAKLLHAFTETRTFAQNKPIAWDGDTEIRLHEEDACSMDTMLSILHYQYCDGMFALSPAHLAGLARVSDKYHCTAALLPWILTWFKYCFDHVTDDETLGVCDGYTFLLEAAYYFRESDQFSLASRHLIPRLALPYSGYPEGPEPENFGRFPPELVDELIRSVVDLRQSIRHLITEAHNYLKKFGGDYYPLERRECSSCEIGWGIVCMCLRQDACPPPLRQVKCTKESRASTFASSMKKYCGVDLPGVVEDGDKIWKGRKPTAQDMRTGLAEARAHHRHRCSADDLCPLICQYDQVYEDVIDALTLVKGLQLDDFLPHDETKW